MMVPYDVSGVFNGKSASINTKYNKMDISILARNMGKVTFTNTGTWLINGWTTNDKIIDYYLNMSVYGIIINGSFTHLDGSIGINKFYNCVFNIRYGGYSTFTNKASVIVQNCIFNATTHKYYTSAPATGSAINCASTNQYMDPKNGVLTNVLYNVTIDLDYNITSAGWQNAGIGTNPDGSVANIGVYGGQFIWGSKISEINTPSSPMNLTATAKENKILLNWNAVDDVTSYNIKRSTMPSGHYDPIASGSAITFVDSDVTPGTTYYYVVSASTFGLESPNSNEASATLPEVPIINILKVVLEVNEQKQLSVTDELSDNTEMTWTSSDISIATVDANGLVKALKSGNTVITCTSEDGLYTETINVLVVDLDLQLAVDLNIGDKCRLTVDDLTDTANVTWTSYDASIATVNSKGRVTAISEGLTLITATDKEGNEIGRIYIRVR